MVDARSIPAGRYAVSAVFWTSGQECFFVGLGEKNLPSVVRVTLPDSLTEDLHLDRLEFVPRNETPKAP